jgi:hypothetical protein
MVSLVCSKVVDFPRTELAPGMVAAQRGHVFVIKQVLGNGQVLATPERA